MISRVLCALAILGLLGSMGCAVPRAPIPGVLFTDVSDGLFANPGPIPANPKTGKAMAMNIIGITLGDSSIGTAVKQGGITKIHYVDYHSWGVMGVYSKTETIVVGE